VIFLAVEWAIYKRLTGWPVDSKGRPQVGADNKPLNSLIIGPPETGRKPSYGVRIPQLKAPYDLSHPLTSKTPDAIRLFEKGAESQGFRNIPVFFEGIDGRSYEDIWPCVTFRCSGFDQNEATFVYFDPFEDGSGDDADILNQNGEVVQSGKSEVTVRKHPESWDLEYTITCYAKTPHEIGLVIESLIYLFPQRGVLEVEQMDGSVLALDMILQRVQDVGARAGSLALQIEKDQSEYYGRAFTYKVEGYFDNTANKFGVSDTYSVPAILKRIVELSETQESLAKPTDYNLLELEQITGE